MLISDFVLLVWKMFVHSFSPCDQELIKQKVKIKDFQSIRDSVDYG